MLFGEGAKQFAVIKVFEREELLIEASKNA